ncbi:NRDE family protein [Virgibacillus sp. NKC19-3]|uniref:NRDE family protein n=1 Tax=Virgibacillus saliphilus TaxID=2831674 RepID=UPI001C9AFC56|nr:NRDE family protein [Virgibacillus sp. NKC19-3]MBY7142805.1 NRDE family protein [Virgibacillus sp. NKC19-3]
MCLINLHVNNHPNYKLIVAANRDEFYERPTAPAHLWEDEPQILAGRDLIQMGTWLGVTKQGRFAALTNFRDPEHMQPGTFSRGEIAKNYLSTDVSPEEFLHTLKQDKAKYVGFNVILGNTEQLFHYNNVHNEITEIPAGTHGLSNDTLNTPWPKVTKGKKKLREYVMNQKEIQPNKLFEIVSDTEEAHIGDLPKTGVGLDFERKLSPLFIRTPDYGTRSSTVLLVDKQDNVLFHERTFDQGELKKENHFSFRIENF